MNPKIKKLAQQSGLEIPADTEFNGHIHRNALEKFAELIVQECAEFVRYKAEKSMSQEILYVGDDLLTHFGVDK